MRPKTVRELYKEEAEKLISSVPPEELKKYSAKAKKIDRFKPVWDTKGTGARNIVKVWAPEVSIGRASAVMCFGHYAVPGNFDKPDSGKNQKISTNSLEFEDASFWPLKSAHLEGVIAQFCPHPRRFRLVWKHQQGDSPLYAWRPIPPSQFFVAMGMIITTSEDEPNLTSIRCMPKAWVVEARMKPRRLWDDAGLGGRPGSMWVVNCFGTVIVTPGHDKPNGPFYDIKVAEYKCHEHSDLSKLTDDTPSPAKVTSRGLGDMPTVSSWLDWRDRSPQGEWGPRFRFYVVLRRDAACIDLYENEPEPNSAPGQPLSSVDLREYRLDTSARVERDARREHCIELFRLSPARMSQTGAGAAEQTGGERLSRQGSVPPKRHYSISEGYAGSTLLGQANKAEKEMWAAALGAVLEARGSSGGSSVDPPSDGV